MISIDTEKHPKVQKTGIQTTSKTKTTLQCKKLCSTKKKINKDIQFL